MPTPHEVVEECFERMADDERRGTIDELFHDDATIRFPGATSEGPDAPTRMLEWLAPRYRWTEKAFDEWIVDGHRVFIRGTLHGVDPDGERLEGVRYVDICEVVDGRISRMDAYSDLLVKGVVPPET
jgi:ketosteroid isomerase-like protein